MLNKEFIPVVDNVSHSQKRQDSHGEFFRKIAEQGHYRGITEPTNTRQGLYCSTSNGVLLASANTTKVGRARRLLTTAIKAWNSTSPNDRAAEVFEESKLDPRYELSVPTDGLALRMTMRDLPRDGFRQPNFAVSNFDHVWFSNAEMKSLIPKVPSVGSSFNLDDKLSLELAQFVLLDSVRGEADAYQRQHVQLVDISFFIVNVTDQRIKMKISGRCKVNRPATGKKNPYSGNLISEDMGSDLLIYGIAEVDRSRVRFNRFEMLAVGPRWGGSTYNVRCDDLASSPIGFGFQLISDISSDPIPPRFHFYNH